MIEPLNTHYSMTNPASVYDEEALTALELAGRTTAKVNEVVKSQNEHMEYTREYLQRQDEDMEAKFAEQDARLDNQEQKQIPATVTAEVQKQIDNGTFDGQINKSLNNLNERVDNLLGAVTEGSTTLDAEVIDLRVDVNGVTHENAGNAVRDQFSNVFKNLCVPITSNPYLITPSAYKEDNFTITEENGYMILEGTPDSSMNYCGFTLNPSMTWEELQGKKVIVFTEEMTSGLSVGVKFSSRNYEWSTSVSLYGSLSTGCVEFPVLESDVLTGNVFLAFDAYNCYTLTELKLKIAVYIMDENIPANVISNVAYYALHHPEIKYVENAGFKSIEGLVPYRLIIRNTGAASLDNNTIHVSTGDQTEEGSYYTVVSVNIYDFIKDMKKVYIEMTGSATNICLTKSQGGWSSLIKNLGLGWNDLTDIDWTEWDRCYFTVGIYGLANVTGSVTPYFVGDYRVIATTFDGVENYPTREEVEVMIASGNPYIVCWGDSLTAGGGWTTTLAELSGMTVYNGGTGGENSRTIMARQGGDAMVINNVTIPADATAVTLATRADDTGLDTVFGYKVTPLLQGGGHVNPVMIDDVEGTLRWTGANYDDTSGTWTFTRSEAGEEKIINRPTVIRTAYDREKNAPHLMIIFIGQNGGYDDLDDLVRQHKLMISHSSARNVVVLGLSSGTAESRAEYETRMRQEFGRYFISLREYLSQYGLEDAGLTATEADTTAMSVGQVPPQLLSDSVHYTSACKTVIGNMLYKKCVELNIFS